MGAKIDISHTWGHFLYFSDVSLQKKSPMVKWQGFEPFPIVFKTEKCVLLILRDNIMFSILLMNTLTTKISHHKSTSAVERKVKRQFQTLHMPLI